MNTPRTNEELETELAAMREAMSQVAANLGNGTIASPDGSIEFLTGIPKEVKLHVSGMARELAAMTKERDELTTIAVELKSVADESIQTSARIASERACLMIELKAEREKVAKLRKFSNHAAFCTKALAPWKPCDCGLEKALEETK